MHAGEALPRFAIHAAVAHAAAQGITYRYRTVVGTTLTHQTDGQKRVSHICTELRHSKDDT